MVKKLPVPLIISIVLGIVAAFLIYTVVKIQLSSVPVVTANQNLKVGTVIQEEHLTVKQMPAVAVSQSSFSNKNQVTGKTVVNGPIVAGDIIRAEHLTTAGSLRALVETLVPEGWSAVELPEGVASGMKGLKKGDKVDIYGEVLAGGGIGIGVICKDAVIVVAPDGQEYRQFIVAVPSEYAPAIAEIMVRNKPLTLVVNKPVVSVTPLPQPAPIEEARTEN